MAAVLAATPDRVRGLFMTSLLALANETRKGLLIRWSYRFDTFTMLFRLSLFFVFISLVIGGGSLSREELPATLLGYIVWFYAAVCITTMSMTLMEEAQTGTLEQMYMTPAPTGIIVLGRSLSALVTATTMVTFIAAVLILTLDIRIPMRLEGLPVFILLLVGLTGFGFMVGGVTLIFKQVTQLGNLAENFIMYLSGVLVPVANMPEMLGAFAKTLPTTQGIIVLRNVVLEGQSIGSAWSDGSMGPLIIHSAIYFVLGWIVFKWAEGIARRQGSLGQY